MKLELVECSEEYWEYVRLLRMNPKVVNSFIQTADISTEQQISYMKNYSCFYRIALLDRKPCGYVGVIDNDIRVCTDPEYQGLGIGKFMIEEIKNIWPNGIAKIKVANEASLKLFESCGYRVEYYLLSLKKEYEKD